MLERRLAEVEQLLARLNTLQDPHMEFTPLPSFFFCGKMAYSMRTVDVSQQEEVLISFDQVMQGALERVIGLLSARLSGHRHRFRWPGGDGVETGGAARAGGIPFLASYCA